MPLRTYAYLSLFLLLPILFSCSGNTSSTHPSRAGISESVYASGYIKSHLQYIAYPRTNGMLEKILVHKGEHVKAGQCLFILSHEVSALNRENARLAATHADRRTQEAKLRELQLAIDISKSKLETETRNLERQRNLWQQEIGSRAELESRQLAFENARSAYETAKLRFDDLKKDLSYAEEQSQKNLRISESMLGDYEVKSEINGRVYAIQKEAGEVVNPQTPLAVIGSDTGFVAVLHVDERDIAQVQPGQKVFFHFDSYGSQVFEGRVDRIIPYMDEKSRNFDVEASFNQTPPQLYPNLSFEANILLKTKDNALLIPRRYLLNGDSVWISKKEKRKVKTGLQDYQQVEILEGLHEADAVYLPD